MRTLALFALLFGFLLSGAACRIGSTASRTTPIQELGSSVDDCLSRNRGKPVLIAFIAQWNQAGVFPRYALETDEARAAIQQHGVIPVVADVTTRKDLLSLEDVARLGVPLMVLHASDRTRKFNLSQDTVFVSSKNGVTMTNGAAVAEFIREHL